jgi:hypothetical protein
MPRYSQEKAIVFLVVLAFLLVSGCWRTKVSDMFSGNKDDVEAMEGELFLDGADERRVPFRVGRDEALEAIDIISQGQPTWGGKYSGVAWFHILYTDGSEDDIEVTVSDFVRINGKPVSVDMDRLLALLQRIERQVQEQEE